MEILAIQTGHLHAGDSLAEHILQNCTLQQGDVLTVSSKVLATVEGAAIDLRTIEVSAEAASWAKKHERSPAFRQAVLNELDRLHGSILDEASKYMRSQVQPTGMETGVILTAAAGLDESNIAEGFAIGWPLHPVESATKLRQNIQKVLDIDIGIIISDSCLLPRRLGVIAQALVVVGFDPIVSHIGKPDLHGRPLLVTNEAIADQLATAANFIMGNADQAIPAAILRNTGVELNSFAGWVPGIDPAEDLFRGLL